MKAATLSGQDFEGHFAKRLSAVECRFSPTSSGSQSEIFASLTSTQPDLRPHSTGIMKLDFPLPSAAAAQIYEDASYSIGPKSSYHLLRGNRKHRMSNHEVRPLLSPLATTYASFDVLIVPLPRGND
jgi:hypothetical protein